MALSADRSELGPDALDPQQQRLPAGWRWMPRRRLALGVSASAAPAWLFVLIGVALGPHGAGVLTRPVLGHLETVVWVGLAVFGVFLGVALMTVDRTDGLLGSGLLASAITVATVAGGLSFLAWEARIPVPSGTPWLLIGICASVSAAVQTSTAASAELRRAVRLADLDDVPLMLAGVALVAWLAGDSALQRLGLTCVAGGAIGLAGWLLFERADASERGVFVTGAVLLLAGTGAYLGTSPLLSGLIAALVWARAPGTADRITVRDLGPLQHPLLALLLIVAGALTQWNAVVLWIAGGLVVVRFAGKLLASVVVARAVRVPPALLASALLQPGVMGIALALNAAQVLGGDYGWIVSVVTTAVVVSEVFAAFLLPYGDEARP